MRNSPSTDADNRSIVFTHPFDNARALLQGESGGGMGTVFAREKAHRSKLVHALGQSVQDLTVLSMDKEPFELRDLGMRVQPVGEFSEGTNIGDFYWDIYDDYDWNLILHPNSVTLPGQDADSIVRLFKVQTDSRAAIGSFDFARDYILQHGVTAKNPGVKQELAKKFGPQIEAIKPGSVVHWSMHSMLRVMGRYADDLRAKECYQTYHHHFPLADNLILHPEGQTVLRTMCKMDAVYFHTEEDISNFLRQCLQLGLTPPKTVSRFKLGIDNDTMESDAQRINKDTFTTEIKNYANLQPGQKRSLEAIAEAETLEIPHQFVCTDRIDMHKGSATLIKGVRLFLESLGKNPSDLAKEYRFFFFHELFDIADYADHRLRHQYIQYCKELYDALERDFPGVIVVSQSIPKEAIPWVLRGKTYLNASNHDGKNLSSMEATFMAAKDDRDNTEGLPYAEGGVIVGGGTGYAKIVKDMMMTDLLHVVQPGNPESIAQNIHAVVRLKTEYPGRLRTMMRELNAEVVMKESDTVMPEPVDA